MKVFTEHGRIQTRVQEWTRDRNLTCPVNCQVAQPIMEELVSNESFH